ncbi:MAG: non-homologous end-joining DNA ligase [Actinomycetota bacterium]|nr:non-homologous end-joining DNA ligase [Actinomycetota bacterium]
MLATLTERRFSHPDWIFERKLDGVRAIGTRHGDEVRLMSRNHKRMEASYPELVEGLAAVECARFVVDGEIVAFEGRRTSFERLQSRIHLRDPERARRTGVAVYYYLFDLLHLDGYDTRLLPLRARKSLLRTALEFRDPLRFTPHRKREGEAYYAQACRSGWEGVIAKRADSRYTSGRSRDWLKFKCVATQEFVICGFTEPHGGRVGFGALLVAYHMDGALRYAGKVGTGYDERTLRALRARLDDLEQDRPPFDEDVREREAHWVQPRLVCEVGFTEWTDDGKLRHPRYLGLRGDKDPGDVVRETPDWASP